MVACVMAGMEEYSKQPAGALYRFNWIFPNEKMSRSSIGFSDDDKRSTKAHKHDASYAHLPPEAIDARVPGGLNDHPVLLIPIEQRATFIQGLYKSGVLPEDFVVSDYIRLGELGKKSRAIYDALLNAYNGDYAQVLNHVQVERFIPSKRYSTAAVTIEPQMSVDAEVHQVTADRSLQSLPKSMANVSLFTAHGPLVDANRGVLEFADLLKRPVETFKYLLGTVETQTISIAGSVISLDQLMIASTNEKYLNAFKEHPDFTSFKGRMELVPVPYLLSVSDEINVYKPVITQRSVGKHVTPHAIEVAAMWGVLTRLRHPDAQRYPKALSEVVKTLTPIEKLRLYDTGQIPKRLNTAQAKELKKAIPDLASETRSLPIFEGATGASARELRTVLLNASYNPRYTGLSPIAVLEELSDLSRMTSVYEFLREDANEGFHEHAKFVRVVENELLDRIDDEVRISMGLTEEGSYEDLFTRYIQHVSHWVKKERLVDRVTGKLIDPDEDFMRDIEKILMPQSDDRVDFRRGLIAQIGANALENPEGMPDYALLFPKHLQHLEDDFFSRRKKQVERNKENFLKYFSERRAELSAKEREQTEHMLKQMTTRWGYTVDSARETIAFLLQKRYAGT
jgi:serine protein kinase